MGCLHAPDRLGKFIQSNPIRVLLGFLLTLLVLCVAIKSAKYDGELTSWIQRTPRIESELNYVTKSIGDGQGSSSQLVLQTPLDHEADILTVDAFMVHLEAMAIATKITVDLYDVEWSLKDICFSPTLPDFDMYGINILDRLMPCVIRTPLDCFWEGSKLLGPEQPINQDSLGLFNAKWTNLNPLVMVRSIQQALPHASFPYDLLVEWMQRVGITTGYQYKPCLDPTDPSCPITAPNKISKITPDIGLTLTGGCRGFATSQMHWKEEELVGGVIKNSSGHIIHATGLQSTIQLMAEHDMYDYWRKTTKVQDINNWDPEKAKSVLDKWQEMFKDKLNEFTRISSTSSSYRIHAMTSNSILETITKSSLLDFTTFVVGFFVVCIYTCISCPNIVVKLELSKENQVLSDQTSFQSMTLPPYESDISKSKTTDIEDKIVKLGVIRTILLSITASTFIGLTFIASLGLNSFMNLPFNIATTQILPLFALFYGFSQFSTISNIYAKLFATVPRQEVTCRCLDEFLPIVLIQSSSYTAAFLVSTLIPVPGVRVFAFQAILYINLATLISLIVIPTILSAYLLHHLESLPNQTNGTAQNEDALDDSIFSRLYNDLKNIQLTSLDFSAQVSSNDINASFRLGTSGDVNPQSSKPSTNRDSMTTNGSSKKFYKEEVIDFNTLPDLLQDSFSKRNASFEYDTESTHSSISMKKHQVDQESKLDNHKQATVKNDLPFDIGRAIICLIAIFKLLVILPQGKNVRYGLELRDIVAYGSNEYDSFLMQEKNFPIYNVYAITKGDFDYPNNQKLLLDYYRAIENINGIVRDEDSQHPRFWLIAFRDWLMDLQEKFDLDKKKHLISVEGWTAETSEAAKLAYKLIVQSGRADNPIDKKLVETNRLVDQNGIINTKGFYHYLTAWVTNDAFTYTNTEANFRPEPKIWNDKPDDLKIERARPLNYAQIPFLMKLPANQDSLRIISQVRNLSQVFEQLGLPNFPVGIPFIFWDQFLNLDLMTLAAVVIIIIIDFLIFTTITSDIKVAAIILLPITMTVLELYCLIGYLSVSFNSVLAVLLIATTGIATIQSVHYSTRYLREEGEPKTRLRKTISHSLRNVITNLLLFSICASVFRHSNIEFMKNYSLLLLCLAIMNTFNSLFLTPVILTMLNPDIIPKVKEEFEDIKQVTKSIRITRPKRSERRFYVTTKRGKRHRIKSAISLSTISEEPQSEVHVHQMKLDFSVKCY